MNSGAFKPAVPVTGKPMKVVSETGSGACRREGWAASPLKKLLAFVTMMSYVFGGFWLSRHDVKFLDDVTPLLFPNVFSLWVKSWVEYLNLHFSSGQMATIVTVFFHQIVYWSLSLPFFLCQFIPWLNHFKIQKHHVSLRKQWDCFKAVLFNQCFIELPLILANWLFCKMMSYHFTWETLPKWYQLLGMIVGCMAVEDSWHYTFHSICHRPSVYKYVHKQHHEFVVPVGMQAEYADPVEVILLGIGFAFGCGIYCNHFFSTWLWMLVRQSETIEVHSGYDIPLVNALSPFHLLPFYGGSRFHDFHHSNFRGNYSSSFECWDIIFETDTQYRQHEHDRKCLHKKRLQGILKNGYNDLLRNSLVDQNEKVSSNVLITCTYTK